jgi:hypothetical protein
VGQVGSAAPDPLHNPPPPPQLTVVEPLSPLWPVLANDLSALCGFAIADASCRPPPPDKPVSEGGGDLSTLWDRADVVVRHIAEEGRVNTLVALLDATYRLRTAPPPQQQLGGILSVRFLKGGGGVTRPGGRLRGVARRRIFGGAAPPLLRRERRGAPDGGGGGVGGALRQRRGEFGRIRRGRGSQKGQLFFSIFQLKNLLFLIIQKY